jgi:hypothetical protein
MVGSWLEYRASGHRRKRQPAGEKRDGGNIHTYLLWQYVSPQVPQGKLESSIGAINGDLQCYQSVLVDRHRYLRLIGAGHNRRSGRVSLTSGAS